MGGALVAGLISGGWATPEHIAVVESLAERRAQLAAAHPGLRVVSSVGEVAGPGASPEDSSHREPGPSKVGGALVAVKPGDASRACAGLAALAPPRVLSIMAGVTIATLEGLLDDGTAVMRAMPNTPALVGAGVAALCGGSATSAADLDWAEGVLRAVGAVVRVPEEWLDAVTAVSGSGPAYVFLLAEALAQAGVAAGLPEPTSRALAVATVAGAGKLLAETGEEPVKLRSDVTSPGGTTARGIAVLEERGLREAVRAAVAAAAERSRELARGEA